ncbi:uncharacterized protein DEA37_0013843 [Paragonimus westermani]|uniref:Ig-like domain-containing protein n=1 Tax=Paragonimus westermani TaxID=34504 RepID=A0A5J4NS27_9TREM|nr:uncharacterized protein DEA37_0013843 [Paragonimus westermani]
MHVKLQSPLDFGRYYVQVHGLNSNYNRYLTSYVTLDDGIVAPTYTVVIREVSGPLYFNSRMELECATNPPNAQARVNWLGPDGQVVSDSSRLVFDKFLYQHQGRYTCQILLPNQVVLRQSVELTASGSVTENPRNGGRYTIAIIQSPLLFRYNDAVRLNCVVSPDPPFVQFEWVKDDQIIGRQSELFIPNFTPYDVGRYVCKARIEGVTDVSSNVTVSPRPIIPGSVDLVMRPDVIYQPVFSPFQIECISERPGVSPGAELSNGAPIETDNRFQLIRPDPQRLIISAPFGLSNVYNGYRIRCILPDTGAKEAILYMIDSCRFNESLCRTRECILTQNLCNGQPDCKDSSDEGDDFCNAGLTFSPTRVVVRPLEAFTLQCRAQRLGYRPQARLVNTRVDVENDPRFTVERPTQDVLIIRAPRGLSLNENNTQIECYFPERGSRIAIINVGEGRCQPGWFACRDGTCIPRTNVCDGVPTCPDGSDEQQCIEYCRPPNIACSSGECITPAMRCDGRRDCRDGFDEEGCPSRCTPPKFACRSGECLAPGLRCDGHPDCADKSDEWDCTEMRECLPPNFQCPSGECLSQLKRCDGRKDCLDGFDEQRCPSDCRPPDVPCPSGECLLSEQICDGRPDCADGWDEKSCAPIKPLLPERQYLRPYSSFRLECRSGQPSVAPTIRLENGTTVEQLPRFQVSRPTVDLVVAFIPDLTERDNGMRLSCSVPMAAARVTELIIQSSCPSSEWMCRDGQCVASHRFCDGRVDCRDGSDEREPHCVSADRCRPGQFLCRSGECISADRRCNGRQDCYDGSDETDCECRSGQPNVAPTIRLENGTTVEQLPRFQVSRPTVDLVVAFIPDLTERDNGMRLSCSVPMAAARVTELIIQSSCPSSEWMCRDGQCVASHRFCDGRVDCRDGSDEREPHCALTRCPVGQFTCGSGECIEQSLRCDGRHNCYDGSDERDCVVGPTMTPQRQTVYPYGSVQVECRSERPGVELSLTVDNGTSVDRLPRFQVTRPSIGVIVARMVNLTERDRGLRLRCYYPTGESTTAEIIIESPCESHERMCRDETCVREEYFCNGREDCRDGSDERPPHCEAPRCGPEQFGCLSGECIRSSLRCNSREDCYDGSDEIGCGLVPTIRPGKPVIRPYEIYQVECSSNQMGVRPDLRLLNGTPVENLPTFTVSRPRLETVIARTSSLTERDSKLVIQ